MATGFTVASGIKTQKKFSNHETSVTASSDKRPTSGIRVKRQSSSSSLEILESKKDNTVPLSRESSSSSLYHPGSSRSRKGQVPPRPDSSSSLGRTTPTTTKQISLQTVKRIDDSDDCSLLDLDVNNEDMEKNLNERLEKLSLGGRSSRNFLRSNSKSELNPSEDLLNERKDEKEKEESSTSSDSEDEDEDEKKAPNELFMEFLTCVMDKDYTTAQKLCKMILIYEPENVEAKSFQKLIDEKILLDDIPDASDDDDDDDDGDNESGNDSDSDDDDSDDSSCDDSSDSSDDDSTVHTTDSGITSASVSD